MKLSIKDIKENIKTTGRCFYHQASDVLYFNWTGCQLEFDFTGTDLELEFCAIAGKEYEGLPGVFEGPFHLNWPWIRIYVNGEEVVHQEIAGESVKVTVPVEPGKKNNIRIIKLTENLKTELGLSGLVVSEDSKISAVESQKRKSIEFIGDSITCGFGNGTLERDRLYFTSEEDAEIAHGVMAAKALGMDYSLVSISGICVTKNPGIPMEYAMDEVYEYTDRVVQDKLLDEKLETYDFKSNPKDYVVLNLGTNDAHGISYQDDYAKGLELVRTGYAKFIETIRRTNGKDTHIVCALGTMGYYLYADIVELVEEYKKKTGDNNISTFRYMQINPFDGYGACGHPCATTHRKMAEEITEYIRSLEQNK